ncbi:MAG TPA: amidohydrolase family protein [Vicinamibacterales bacterium]|nr:amidohydrolase family protein [Vicinamibacterales bacterium]
MTEHTSSNTPRRVEYKRIATEEAWAPAELLSRYRSMAANRNLDDPGFIALWTRLGSRTQLGDRLADIGEGRIADMDVSGIDMQILSLTSPGVQVFDAATANAIAVDTNDQVAQAVRTYPSRFAGLAAVAPQDPRTAAREIDRAVRTLGLKGVIINSHTGGEFLDDPKFWEIFEAAEALSVPIYIHPQAPPPAMIGPYVERGLEGALWGFGAETGLHALAIIRSGALDRFPKLRIVIGHGGEALPFWLFRLDYMNRTARPAIRTGASSLARQISEYLKENFYVTTSGMAWAPVITFIQSVLGVDRVLYAMDYPYQFEISEVIASDETPMTAEDRKKFFQTNAERVFALG